MFIFTDVGSQACTALREAILAELDRMYVNSVILPRLAKIQFSFIDPEDAIDHLSVWSIGKILCQSP